MNFEDDFVSSDIIKFKIDNKEFGYKPTTAGDENAWIDEYIEQYVDDQGVMRTKQNYAKLNRCKLRNLVLVPYTNELIKSKLGVDKDWNGLREDQKWQLLGMLKPKTFNAIISEINRIDAGNEEGVNF